MNYAECVECGDEYNYRRRELGYYTCLDCGGQAAKKESARKARCSAPAYNKGCYMYITTIGTSSCKIKRSS